MRKTLTALSLALVLVIAGCGDDDDDDGGTVAADETDDDAGDAGGTVEEGSGDAEGRAVELVASNFAFEPAHIDAEAGEQLAITYRNEDGTDHTFTATDPEVGETVAGGEEATFSVTVPESGVLEYHCAIHPQMTGTIGAEGEAAGLTDDGSADTTATGPGGY
jgi:plastocyanin